MLCTLHLAADVRTSQWLVDNRGKGGASQLPVHFLHLVLPRVAVELPLLEAYRPALPSSFLHMEELHLFCSLLHSAIFLHVITSPTSLGPPPAKKNATFKRGRLPSALRSSSTRCQKLVSPTGTPIRDKVLSMASVRASAGNGDSIAG